MTLRMMLVLSLMCVLTACGASEEAQQIASLTGDAAAGEPLYQSNCAACHGQDARGGTYDVDLVDHATHHEDEHFAQVILSGDGDMPAFEGQLEDQEIADIIAYIRSL